MEANYVSIGENLLPEQSSSEDGKIIPLVIILEILCYLCKIKFVLLIKYTNSKY